MNLGLARLSYDGESRLIAETPAMHVVLEADPNGACLQQECWRLASGVLLRRRMRTRRTGAATVELVTSHARYELRAVRTRVDGCGIGALVHIHAHPTDRTGGAELEVARSLARGLSNAQVAQALGVAERTAAHHVERGWRKLGASSRSAASFMLRRLS